MREATAPMPQKEGKEGILNWDVGSCCVLGTTSQLTTEPAWHAGNLLRGEDLLGKLGTHKHYFYHYKAEIWVPEEKTEAGEHSGLKPGATAFKPAQQGDPFIDISGPGEKPVWHF